MRALDQSVSLLTLVCILLIAGCGRKPGASLTSASDPGRGIDSKSSPIPMRNQQPSPSSAPSVPFVDQTINQIFYSPPHPPITFRDTGVSTTSEPAGSVSSGKSLTASCLYHVPQCILAITRLVPSEPVIGAGSIALTAKGGNCPANHVVKSMGMGPGICAPLLPGLELGGAHTLTFKTGSLSGCASGELVTGYELWADSQTFTYNITCAKLSWIRE